MKVKALTQAALAAVLTIGSGAAVLAAPHHRSPRRPAAHAVHRPATPGAALKVGRPALLAGGGKAAGESLKLTVARVTTATVLRNNADMDYTQYAQAGTNFLVVTMHLVAGAKAVPARNLVLLVKGAKGKVYRVNSAAGIALGSNNYPSTFAPHKTVTESEAFSVPTGAAGLVLSVALGSGKPVLYTLPKG